MKAKFLALLAVVMFAGSALFSAETAGIGINFGVGVGQYDDSRYSSVSTIVELDIQIDKNISLTILNEKQSVAFDDENRDFDYISSYTGMGLSVDVNKYVSIGIGIGKMDNDNATGQYADFAMELKLIEGSGDKVGYSLSFGLKRRMIEVDDFDFGFPSGDVENYNHTQFTLKAGLVF